MKKYIIKEKSFSIPSDDSIKKHKNFNNVLNQHQKLVKGNRKPIYKDPKFFLLIVLIVVIAYLLAEIK